MQAVDFSRLRNEMVENQLVSRGIRDPAVLDAMRIIPREKFLPEAQQEFAYDDNPLPIGAGQTISQPYIVALMIEALQTGPGERVLEIGTGSGYAAAVLDEIAAEVYSVERVQKLAALATSNLGKAGYPRVNVLCGDGTRGWPEHAPFDGIIVAAGGPVIPESLKAQLKVGGRLVMPVGKTGDHQKLVRIVRQSTTRFEQQEIADVRFVPLIGEEGWPSRQLPNGGGRTGTVADS